MSYHPSAYAASLERFYRALDTRPAAPQPPHQRSPMRDQHYRPVNAREERFIRDAEAQR